MKCVVIMVQSVLNSKLVSFGTSYLLILICLFRCKLKDYLIRELDIHC